MQCRGQGPWEAEEGAKWDAAMRTPKASSAAPHVGGEGHSTAESRIGGCSAHQSGGERGEQGNSQLVAENFKSSGGCNAMRLSSIPTSKELGWKQPFDAANLQ